MEHLIAIVALGAACIVWYYVQMWAAAGRAEASEGADGGEACGACTQRETCHEQPLPAPHRKTTTEFG